MTSRLNWDEILVNKQVRDAYSRFAKGTATAADIRRELSNTDHSTTFNRILKARGSERTRDAARLALSRRQRAK
jgi:hypothetical protein